MFEIKIITENKCQNYHVDGTHLKKLTGLMIDVTNLKI